MKHRDSIFLVGKTKGDEKQGAPSKAFSCVLGGFDGENITVTGDFGELVLPLADVSAINYDDFDDDDLLNGGE